MHENKSRTPSTEKPARTMDSPVKPAWPPESAIRLSRAPSGVDAAQAAGRLGVAVSSLCQVAKPQQRRDG